MTFQLSWVMEVERQKQEHDIYGFFEQHIFTCFQASWNLKNFFALKDFKRKKKKLKVVVAPWNNYFSVFRGKHTNCEKENFFFCCAPPPSLYFKISLFLGGGEKRYSVEIFSWGKGEAEILGEGRKQFKCLITCGNFVGSDLNDWLFILNTKFKKWAETFLIPVEI